LIAKYQRRFPGFDEKIVSMYPRGISVREIQGHIRELFGLDVSPDLINTFTDAVLEEVAVWQNRPLEPVYPLVFFDAGGRRWPDNLEVIRRAHNRRPV
jgi:putative transposase